ncbi:hypothetical protein ABNF97_14065 [Plantactinospora sp. B6F1]|uniref:hypothetical protein n=1 Tax=Plantactinospora sp. B6F1 TaxID=3158971 RepID=UPI0010D88404
MTEHDPVGPDWICATCAADWPCPSRRRELRAEFGPLRGSLGAYLGNVLAVAAEDLRHVPAGWLHNRFVAWHRPDEPVPYTSVDILLRSAELADAHSPDQAGRCPVCGDPELCWVRLHPGGPGFLIPLP